mgnify:FL=1
MDAFLRVAIAEARISLTQGGIPAGSALIRGGIVLGRGHDRCLQGHHRLLHAELQALENAGPLPDHIYAQCTLYSTMPPCCMCAGAILLLGIPRVVVGDALAYEGELNLLKARGVQVEVLEDPRCHELLETVRRRHPECWRPPAVGACDR